MQDAPVRADCARRLRVYRVALISEFVRNVVLGKIAELYGTPKVGCVYVQVLAFHFHPYRRLARKIPHQAKWDFVLDSPAVCLSGRHETKHPRFTTLASFNF